MAKKRKPFNKYEYYERAVQSPDSDVSFFKRVFRELKRKEPKSFREDFCGTFALCQYWVKSSPECTANGVDLDLEPITYGTARMKERLREDQQKRLKIFHKNVLTPSLPKTDIVAALNFSHFIFREHTTMKQYFTSVREHLKPGGIFILDSFGGSKCYEPNTEKTRHKGFTYFWEQETYDPIPNRARFHIHFQIHKGRKHSKVFTYDWRLWSIPELRDVLRSAGFSKTHVYWEGTSREGGGNGVFRRTEKGEICDSWIAYVVAEK